MGREWAYSKTMSDNQYGDSDELLMDYTGYFGICRRIDASGRFIENEHFVLLEQCTSQDDELLLASGETVGKHREAKDEGRHGPLADYRVGRAICSLLAARLDLAV
jgi:hypothetical protein